MNMAFPLKNNFKQVKQLKEILKTREKANLCSSACFSHFAKRRHKEKFVKNEYRQSFAKDSDKILNSLAFTRYIDKTQVFSLINNDHISQRVIHVQLVSRIARTIGRYLNLNEDLIEAASLGHDIGHSPFGHDGERFLRKLTIEHKAGAFHHNLQSIQCLDKIEKKGKGWNLSLQTMDAILCHNGESLLTRLYPQKSRSFDDFDDIITSMKKNKTKDPIPMTLEGCVVRISDTISYLGRDMEDGVRLGLVKRSDLPLICQKILGTTNGSIVFALVTDLIEHSLNQDFIGFSDETAFALKKLRIFNYKYIYKNPAIKKHLNSIESIFKFLFEKYLDDLEKENQNSLIFTDFLNGMLTNYRENHSNPEIVRDYISGMTDTFFIRQAPEDLKPYPVENI